MFLSKTGDNFGRESIATPYLLRRDVQGVFGVFLNKLYVPIMIRENEYLKTLIFCLSLETIGTPCKEKFKAVIHAPPRIPELKYTSTISYDLSGSGKKDHIEGGTHRWLKRRRGGKILEFYGAV